MPGVPGAQGFGAPIGIGVPISSRHEAERIAMHHSGRRVRRPICPNHSALKHWDPATSKGDDRSLRNRVSRTVTHPATEWRNGDCTQLAFRL